MTRDFFEKHYPLVVSSLRHRGAGNNAGDLAQDVFLTLCRTYGHLPDSELERVIWTVVSSRSIDWLRKGKLQLLEEDDPQPSTQVSEGSELERLAELEAREEDVHRVRAAIARLTQEQQAVMVRGVILGYSDSKIAGLLRISEDNVQQRRKRAKERLQQILQEGD